MAWWRIVRWEISSVQCGGCWFGVAAEDAGRVVWGQVGNGPMRILRTLPGNLWGAIEVV